MRPQPKKARLDDDEKLKHDRINTPQEAPSPNTTFSGKKRKRTGSATYEPQPQEKRKNGQKEKDTSENSLNDKRLALLPFRQKLPIWNEKQTIRESLRGSKDVMVLVGETGSGKSTQVPQFLLEEDWCTGGIAVTQPRRVAAISLARRVADEMGTPLGSASPASKVGYSVRFDSSVSPGTRVKYLTEGMLLQELLRDPYLRQYSVVVVDEVHERSVNVDLILGFLRNLVNGDKKGRKGKPLKVVVMSATADVDSLVNFFKKGFRQSQALPDNALSPKQSKASKLLVTAEEAVKDDDFSNRISVCHVQGRQFPVDTIYLPAPTQDFVEAALKCIFQIHYKEPMPGDILVFLTGQDTVETLERLVNDYAASMGPEVPKIITLPLFAALPQFAQQKVFQPAPHRTRKVILSTNIAETSVTVPGVRFVVDSGKVKIKQFRNRLGLDSLLVKPVSQSSAIQRKGRAGREGPGKCYHLYTEKDFKQLQARTMPEILRCDLAGSILTMKARGVEDVVGFPLLDPPPREALEKALLQLLQLEALDTSGNISKIGKQLAKFPISPSLGRALVEAAQPENDCLADVIDIISCLSVENIFLNLVTEEKKEAAEMTRKELYKRDGDHLTMLAAVRAYAAEETNRKAWAERYFISHRAMQSVMDVRKQLFALCKQSNLLPSDNEARNESILRSFLKGFASNTARLMPDGSYRTLLGNQTVSIHPSSVLFGKKVEAIMFSEFVFTNKSYGRNVSAVRLKWIEDVLAGPRETQM
ncbi:ATP-dependent RNA helicase [Trichodelitschia bisporula]|uniref:RNA helicase n=1 Tax=Trichodelitschia bisporula TaxID=703511 RepID=A0A6G1HV32_9PEZI|nr:ATP-dependent RNA helicase [Trichodelitschia bisporula]